MCGRFTLSHSGREIAEHFELGEVPDLAPRYNIAPSQETAAVRVGAAGTRCLELRRFGLVPSWAKTPTGSKLLINARLETADIRPAFRSALRSRRCLVPADGFYEWKAHPGGRRPHHVRLDSGGLFALAGLYEDWSGGEGSPSIPSFTLLTTEATQTLRSLHGRMPVVVDPYFYAAWLDPEQRDAGTVLGAMTHRLAERLHAHPVGFRVNDVRNDDLACLEADPSLQLRLGDF